MGDANQIAIGDELHGMAGSADRFVHLVAAAQTAKNAPERRQSLVFQTTAKSLRLRVFVPAVVKRRNDAVVAPRQLGRVHLGAVRLHRLVESVQQSASAAGHNASGRQQLRMPITSVVIII